MVAISSISSSPTLTPALQAHPHPPFRLSNLLAISIQASSNSTICGQSSLVLPFPLKDGIEIDSLSALDTHWEEEELLSPLLLVLRSSHPSFSSILFSSLLKIRLPRLRSSQLRLSYGSRSGVRRRKHLTGSRRRHSSGLGTRRCSRIIVLSD